MSVPDSKLLYVKLENEIHFARQSRKFSKDEAGKLISFLSIFPRHVDAHLLLLELAYIYGEFFPEHWTVYYNHAKNLHEPCWATHDMARIHARAATIYSHDQLTDKTNQAIYTAYELDPTNWSIVDAYISKTRPYLDEEIAISLIEKINKLAPDDCIAQYRRGYLLERYAREYHNYDYKIMSLTAYQKALNLNLENHVIEAVIVDVKEAIKRLSHIES